MLRYTILPVLLHVTLSCRGEGLGVERPSVKKSDQMSEGLIVLELILSQSNPWKLDQDSITSKFSKGNTIILTVLCRGVCSLKIQMF